MKNLRVFHDKTKFTQYLSTNQALQRIIHGKLQYKEGNYTLEKVRKESLKTKEGNHTNIFLPLTTKIKGSDNHFSLISLNIKGLNFPIKRHRLADWIHKQDPAFCYIQNGNQ